MNESTKNRLEYLRAELRAERISCEELAELQDLAPHIDSGDVELLEAAGVPENPVTVYDALKDAGCELDHHQSDLYVKDTPEAREIINQYGIRIVPFRSETDHSAWLELPFMYQPFWDQKNQTMPGCCTDSERGYDGDPSWG